jgi:hypothetical protein
MYNGQMKFHSEGIRGYAVTEQPGDMTKYTHIIIPYSSSKLFVVSADPLGGGASIRFNSSVYVQYSLVRDIMETFNTMDDVHDHAAFMNNYFVMNRNGSDTRCVHIIDVDVFGKDDYIIETLELTLTEDELIPYNNITEE